MKLLVMIFLNLVFLGFRAEATTYTVKSGGGGDFTTIQTCANKAIGGDSCAVFAGTYAGWTQPSSGSAGESITFTVNTGDNVVISSGVNLSSRSYINISHFAFSSSGITGNGTTSHNVIDHNTFSGQAVAFRINDGQGSGGSDNVFSNNVVNIGSNVNNTEGLYLYGDRNLIDGNIIENGGGDCFDLGGNNVVVRNNYCHDQDGSRSGEHIDFIQVMGGGTSPTLTFSLVEGNVEQNCTNDSDNCHFVMIRTGSGPVADTVIVRFNFAQNLNGSGASFGGIGDSVPNSAFYNNTIATGNTENSSGECASYQNAPNSGAFNNICYNTGGAGLFGVGGCLVNGLNGDCNGNLEFVAGYSSTWQQPYSLEATYNTLKNQNPDFANFPTDGSLSTGSPAIGAGVAIAHASGSGSSTTSLTVANSVGAGAHVFQAGWAGTQADWIRIGASTTVQISAIDYSRNVITLASPASWNNNDPIYLYKNSAGTVVLSGATPDVGAYPYGQGGAPPNPPTGLSAIVN